MTVLDYVVPPVSDTQLPDSPPAVVPPAVAPPANAPTPINIKVWSRDGTGQKFLIKKTTRFDKLITTYYTICDLPENSVIFRFNGTQISRTDTPSSLGMEDGDALEALHDWKIDTF